MFGYVTINEQELKIKDYNTYRGFYCGQCEILRTEYGLSGQAVLNYDLTFLAILLTGLYEAESKEYKKRCILHPVKKTKRVENSYVKYAADMTVLLAYYQCLDHWKDNKNFICCMEAGLLRSKVKEIKHQYPRQFQAVLSYVKKQEVAQQEKESNLDKIAGLTGAMLAEIFIYQEDVWSEELRKMGFFLGKFIYLMDAYEDLEKDIKKGSYNPLFFYKERDDYEAYCYTILTMMMADCAKKFEVLPILMYADILKNILYSGVWKKYELLIKKRIKEGKKDESI